MSPPQVLPNTWFCEGGTGGCREIRASIGPLLRLPTRRPPVLRVAAPPGWVTASLLLLAITTVAVAAAGLLWGRRQHRRYIASLAGAAGCQRLVSECPAAASSVLLLHLARSDAERAAVRQLAAELSVRGAAVTDSDSPQWRSAARMDATGLASAVPAHDRVLLLSSPAVAAAAAGSGGGGERERLFAAAVRQLTGSGLTSNYGRVYQARLTTEAAHGDRPGDGGRLHAARAPARAGGRPADRHRYRHGQRAAADDLPGDAGGRRSGRTDPVGGTVSLQRGAEAFSIPLCNL